MSCPTRNKEIWPSWKQTEVINIEKQKNAELSFLIYNIQNM